MFSRPGDEEKFGGTKEANQFSKRLYSVQDPGYEKLSPFTKYKQSSINFERKSFNEGEGSFMESQNGEFEMPCKNSDPKLFIPMNTTFLKTQKPSPNRFDNSP